MRNIFKMKKSSKIVNLGDKKGGPIDITILVFMALVLAGGTLVIFYLNGNYVSSNIQDSRFLQETYIKEGKMDFYINEMMQNSISKINNRENPVPEFFDNFKIELQKYKTNGTYVFSDLIELEKINEENIQFSDGKLILSVNINLKQEFEDKFIVNYNYNKQFEKFIMSFV